MATMTPFSRAGVQQGPSVSDGGANVGYQIDYIGKNELIMGTNLNTISRGTFSDTSLNFHQTITPAGSLLPSGFSRCRGGSVKRDWSHPNDPIGNLEVFIVGRGS